MSKTNYKLNYPDGISLYFWRDFVVPTIKKIKGNKCEFCGSKYRLHIYHKDYVEEVSINTLQLLCAKCHRQEHKSY